MGQLETENLTKLATKWSLNLASKLTDTCILHATPVLNNKNKQIALVSWVLKEQPHHVVSPPRCQDWNRALESPKGYNFTTWAEEQAVPFGSTSRVYPRGTGLPWQNAFSGTNLCTVSSAQLNSWQQRQLPGDEMACAKIVNSWETLGNYIWLLEQVSWSWQCQTNLQLNVLLK